MKYKYLAILFTVSLICLSISMFIKQDYDNKYKFLIIVSDIVMLLIIAFENYAIKPQQHENR